MKFADLHLHTQFSDGTFSPEELVSHAQKHGLACIALPIVFLTTLSMGA